MTPTLGSTVTIEVSGVSGIVTYCDDNEYVVCYSIDGKIEFKTIKITK